MSLHCNVTKKMDNRSESSGLLPAELAFKGWDSIALGWSGSYQVLTSGRLV